MSNAQPVSTVPANKTQPVMAWTVQAGSGRNVTGTPGIGLVQHMREETPVYQLSQKGGQYVTVSSKYAEEIVTGSDGVFNFYCGVAVTWPKGDYHFPQIRKHFKNEKPVQLVSVKNVTGNKKSETLKVVPFNGAQLLVNPTFSTHTGRNVKQVTFTTVMTRGSWVAVFRSDVKHPTNHDWHLQGYLSTSQDGTEPTLMYTGNRASTLAEMLEDHGKKK